MIKPKKLFVGFSKYGPYLNLSKIQLQPFIGASQYELVSTPESRQKALDELISTCSIACPDYNRNAPDPQPCLYPKSCNKGR